MTTDIIIIHNDPSFNISSLNFPFPVYVTIYDTGTKHGKKKGWEIKSEWSAREDPFIICYENNKPQKCFYSEADNNIYKSLIEYLNEQSRPDENSSC